MKNFTRFAARYLLTSTGLNVVGAIQLAKQMSPNENVVTLGCDSGLKYLAQLAY